MPHIKKLFESFIKIYPGPLRNFLGGSVVISKEERFIKNKRVDGSYDIETGQVILWSPNETHQEDLFIVLTHEWGHKIYHEWLSDKEKENWLIIRSKERIDFDLDKSYPALKLPEEEYCTVFCLVSKVLYWKKMGMRDQSKKLSEKMRKSFPLASKLVETQIQKSAQQNKRLKDRSLHDITHQEVETIKAWIRQAIEN